MSNMFHIKYFPFKINKAINDLYVKNISGTMKRSVEDTNGSTQGHELKRDTL